MGVICGGSKKKKLSDSNLKKVNSLENKIREDISPINTVNNKGNIKSIYLKSENNQIKKSDDNISQVNLINILKSEKQNSNIRGFNFSSFTNIFKKNSNTTNETQFNLMLNKEEISKIIQKFYLKEEDLKLLFFQFKKIDKENSGYITIINIYNLIDQNPTTSNLGPFIDRFFVLIEKKNFYKATFEEFIPNLISFCLFSTIQIIEFMFNFIDKDHDNFITKNDIKNILKLKREEKEIFHENYLKSIDNLKGIKRIDKINIEDFVDICKKLPFIFHPLIVFQEKLREKFVGKKYWEKLEKEIRVKFTKNLKIQENEKIYKKIMNIKDKLIEQKKAKMKEIEIEKQEKIYNQDIRVGRRNSDTAFIIGKYLEKKRSQNILFKNKSFKKI